MRTFTIRLVLALVVVFAVVASAFAQETVATITSSVTGIVTGFTWLETAVFVGLVISGAGYLLSRVIRSGR